MQLKLCALNRFKERGLVKYLFRYLKSSYDPKY